MGKIAESCDTDKVGLATTTIATGREVDGEDEVVLRGVLQEWIAANLNLQQSTVLAS